MGQESGEWLRFVLVVAGVVAVLGLAYVLGSGGLTGLMTTDPRLSVSIDGDSAAEISSFDFDQFIRIGESITISAEIANRGTVPLDGTFDIEVYDTNNTLQYTYPGPNGTLQPGTHMGREYRHTPHETGTYTLRMQAEMGGTRLQTTRHLIVLEEPEPDVDMNPDPIIIERTRVRYLPPLQPEPEPEPEPKTPGWTVDVPRSVELEQGGTTSIPIQIQNTGEATLRNIELVLQSPKNMALEYDPKIQFAIPANQSRTFMLTASTPEDVRGPHRITYSVSSNRLSRSGEIEVNVVPALTAAQLRGEADRLELMLEDLTQELDDAEATGLDVTDAHERLAAAQTTVAEIYDHIDAEEFDAARNQMETARSQIGTAYQMLFKLRSEQLVVRAPLVRPLYLLLIGAVVVAVLMVGTYYYIREKRNRRPKLLRRMDKE